MSTPDARTEQASAFYNQAARQRTESCQTGCCSSGLALARGYTPADIAAVPKETSSASFGCGNPLAFTEIQSGQTVVDLGCGAGLDVLLAAKRVGPTGRVIGIDVNEEMLERTRSAAQQAGLGNVEARQGVMEELPVEDSSADWVISNCVINLSPDKPAVFREIARVLRPSGRMLVSDIVCDGLSEEFKQLAVLHAACIAGAIDEESYLSCVREAGLERVEVVDRQVYDRSIVRYILTDELPINWDQLAGTFSISGSELLDQVTDQLAGKLQSIRVAGVKA